MTIKEMEEASGLPRANIRFYENEGFISPARGDNGYRDYSFDDLKLLKRVKLLRQLKIPLDEIRALKTGSADLSGVLDRRIAQIGDELRQLEDSRIVCGEILRDGVTFSNLDATKYLDRLKNRPGSDNTFLRTDAVSLPKANFPWRRFFARAIDSGLYEIAWHMLAYFVFRWNLSGLSFITTIVSCLLMLLIEPVFLHFFGTTPGKAVFGIKITQLDKSKLTLSQGYSRTWEVLWSGQGLGIPIYALYRQYKSYKLCKESGEMDWDYDNSYTMRDKKIWRPAVFALITAAMVTVLFLIPYAADMPKHRGDITAEQFCENMNRALRYHKVDGSVGELDNGAYSAVAHYAWSEAPELQITEEHGVVTEVILKSATGRLMMPETFQQWLYPAIISYVGAQKSLSFWDFHFGSLFDSIRTRSAYDSYGLIIGNIEIVYNLIVDGQEMSDRNYYINYIGNSISNSPHLTESSTDITVIFSMRKT